MLELGHAAEYEAVEDGPAVKGDRSFVSGFERLLELLDVARDSSRIQPYVAVAQEEVVALDAATGGVEQLRERMTAALAIRVGPENSGQFVTADTGRPGRGNDTEQREQAPLGRSRSQRVSGIVDDGQTAKCQ
jgi:hypothetical protein